MTNTYPYITPVDQYGRKWPEFCLPNHKVWLCGECGQPELRGPCNHKQMNKKTVKKLGGKL